MLVNMHVSEHDMLFSDEPTLSQLFVNQNHYFEVCKTFFEKTGA